MKKFSSPLFLCETGETYETVSQKVVSLISISGETIVSRVSLMFRMHLNRMRNRFFIEETRNFTFVFREFRRYIDVFKIVKERGWVKNEIVKLPNRPFSRSISHSQIRRQNG